MKTILHYKAGSYLPITETWIHEQIKNLKKYQPVIYAHDKENMDIFPLGNIKIRSLELKKGLRDPFIFFNEGWNKVFNFYPIFAFNLIKDRPKLVHAHFGPSGYSFLKLKKMFNFPLITTFYGFDLSMLPQQYPEWKIRYKRLFKEGEKFLVEGHHMKKCLIDLGCPEERIIVQHLGIDLEKIKYVPRKLLDENKEIRILISASFREKKGIPYAVEAFVRVKQAHPEMKFILTIIGDSRGTSAEEKEKKKIFDTIDKYNIKDCVKMLGYQPYSVFLRELYQHHVFLHPSVHASDGDTEGGAPVSIIEASASGMPILSTMHCDIPEVVINGESGYLVPERDAEVLAERLEFIICHPKVWEQMGEKGREHVEKNYNVITQVEKLEEIYDNMMTER